MISVSLAYQCFVTGKYRKNITDFLKKIFKNEINFGKKKLAYPLFYWKENPAEFGWVFFPINNK